MRPPHNTMGPGMPGVNMWALSLFKHVLSHKLSNFNAISYWVFYLYYHLGAQGPVGHGPILTMPTLWVLMCADVCTHTHTYTHLYQRNAGSDCSQISSQSCEDLMCSKVLVWDVIVVLCVMVSTDSYNAIRMIKWWMMTFWGIEDGLPSHFWSVMFVFLVSDALLITLSWCIWGEKISWNLNSHILFRFKHRILA